MMKVVNAENISVEKIEQIKQVLPQAESLWQLMGWLNAQNSVLPEVIVQDEFTHDVIIPYKDVFLVFDTTWLGAITAVAVWEEQPDADKILQFRLKNGWKPKPSSLKGGDKVLGHASCVINSWII